MQAVPQIAEQFTEIGRVLMMGTVSVVGGFMLLAGLAYLWMCAGSCRQWNALEQRWARPSRDQGWRLIARRLL